MILHRNTLPSHFLLFTYLQYICCSRLSAYRLWHSYCRVWVFCFKTTNIIVLCMSSVLIHMYYFSFNIILSLQSHFSETLVVGLINTAMIVDYFVWGHHSVFDIVIVTCECAVSKLRIPRSIVCQHYYYKCLTCLIILFCHSICAVLNYGSWV